MQSLLREGLKACRPVTLNIQQARSVVFVRGERVRGLIRDPEDILTSNGRRYGLNDANLKPLKQFLGDEYKLTDKMILQVITHKSFAHGTRPYNEKLSILGEELLRLAASKYALAKGVVNGDASDYKFSVGDINFDCLGSLTHRLIVTNRLLSEYAESQGIDKVFFCKVALPRNYSQDQAKDYKPKAMYSTITSSLVGAIAIQRGKNTAEKFVQEKVLAGILPAINERK
ncbi:hypothetical protein FOA43_000934 [Brettanomyces nanus]|uniref:RNase III domain-containing protein n=1 Tax=Eeniella nana TaxID=13502 RepID=A0A875S0H6_EENNA|nr:uncharacterized protein FOA43_000934 [Brettanomyces nanus]QPG73622.1 hypothetical protein FOA43_000934 [Brettanomyces nanus]